MAASTHDPSEYIHGLQQLLISDKKKIAFLFGAGTSLAKKNNHSINIPCIGEMTRLVEEALNRTPEFETAIKEIKDEIGHEKFTVETFLSNIESKKDIIGTAKLNGLDINQFKNLVQKTKDEVRKIVSVHEQILENNGIKDLIHVDFAEWIGRAERKYPIEIFTTNYDYFFEIGLETKNIPFYDGFTGSLNPFFDDTAVDNMQYLPETTKLWKIHGSLGWHDGIEKGKIIRKATDENDIIIYPSLLKYNNSKKQPYTALMDRLTNYLKLEDTVLIVAGYSFGDEHINERILTALKSNASAHVCVLHYDTIKEDTEIAKIAFQNSKISVFGKRNAIIGCQLGEWQLKREPDKDDSINIDTYFDEDVAVDDCIEISEKSEANEIWSGKGELAIRDFVRFIGFLRSMFEGNDLRRVD